MKKRFLLWVAGAGALTVVVLIAMIVRAERVGTQKLKSMPIIAEVYNSGTGELGAYVYATNAQHPFPNGTTGEAWLMRAVNIPGDFPAWITKPTNARVVWRKQ
jgi:hypothetical protein